MHFTTANQSRICRAYLVSVADIYLDLERKLMEQTFMKEKPIKPLVISMALPMVISMLVNSLYNIVDSYFVAQISEEAMTALSLVYPIQNLITSIAVGFSIGVNATIAFYLGAGNQKKADKAATDGILFNIVHGILLLVGCFLFMPAFLRFFTANEMVISYGLTYSRIAFSFSVVITVGIAFEKIFQSVGRMKVSMISMMAGCIANIILDPILIFGVGPVPEMGIKGAAIATGVGQVITLIAYLLFAHFRPLPLTISFSKWYFDKGILGRLYGIGIPATFNMALPSFLITALNTILTAFSGTYVLVLGVYYKLQTFLYLPANGIIQGIRPLIGYNYGAKEQERVKQIYRFSLMLIVGIMVIGTGLCELLPKQLMGMFTKNPSTLQLGVSALRIICLGFIVSSVSVTFSGTLEGLGKGIPSFIISLLRYVVIIIPTAFILSRFYGAKGVWMAFGIAELLTAVVAGIIFRRNYEHT